MGIRDGKRADRDHLPSASRLGRCLQDYLHVVKRGIPGEHPCLIPAPHLLSTEATAAADRAGCPGPTVRDRGRAEQLDLDGRRGDRDQADGRTERRLGLVNDASRRIPTVIAVLRSANAASTSSVHTTTSAPWRRVPTVTPYTSRRDSVVTSPRVNLSRRSSTWIAVPCCGVRKVSVNPSRPR